MILKDGCHRCRESGCYSYDLISTFYGSISEFGSSKGTERKEVGGRAGVDEQAEPDAEIVGEPLLELPRVASVCQPELERRVDEVHHLLLVEDAPGVVDAPLAGHEFSRLLRLMNELVILGDLAENVLLQFFRCHIFNHGLHGLHGLQF